MSVCVCSDLFVVRFRIISSGQMKMQGVCMDVSDGVLVTSALLLANMDEKKIMIDFTVEISSASLLKIFDGSKIQLNFLLRTFSLYMVVELLFGSLEMFCYI